MVFVVLVRHKTMPRTRRIAPANCVQHVLNRGNRKQQIFHKPQDYNAFYDLLSEVLDHVPMRIIGAAVMPNHFHLVVWPDADDALSAFMTWLMNAHVHRYQKHHGLTGTGHIYQGRYKNFIVQNDAHFYKLMRYVEANPLRANLVTTAQDWGWSSASRTLTPSGHSYLSEWPIPRPENWLEYVNSAIPPDELSALQYSVRRGRPYGEERWVQTIAMQYGLEQTLRERGRRSKKKGTATISRFE